MDRLALERLFTTEIGRRRTLIGAGALAGLAVAASVPFTATAAPPVRFVADPFALGVASGDPRHDSVVLWTRLAPAPLEDGGGLPPSKIPVRWEIAADATFQAIVDRGWTMAAPELGHSVHVDVYGLKPGRWYWYRFMAGDAVSPTGRTRTLPAWTTPTDRLRFAFASCQDYQNGFFPAYRGMAAEDLDLVVHLGDYIYEYGPRAGGPRQHEGPEVESLESYRKRHALYKLDPHLQAAHAAFPFIAVWDDHEVENDYAGATSEDKLDPRVFLPRRANGYQAYYEHMPLRRSAMPRGSTLQLYRRFTYGDLAEFTMLDTRQYRSEQPACSAGLLQPRCAEALSPSQTMTGPNQERWLLQGLERSRARWNIIGQQTMMGQLKIPGVIAGIPGVDLYNMDQWDGYVAARQRILSFLHHQRPANPVVLTGDIHSSWVHSLKLDFDDPTSPPLATEFVGTSITSDFPAAFIPAIQAALPANPHITFFDGARHGYVRCEVTRARWRSDFRVVESILTPDSPVSTLASFVVLDGQPGAHPA